MLVASEVDPVMRALVGSVIEITALYNHMLDDQPRLLFMHLGANEDGKQLARGLRTALNAMNLLSMR